MPITALALAEIAAAMPLRRESDSQNQRALEISPKESVIGWIVSGAVVFGVILIGFAIIYCLGLPICCPTEAPEDTNSMTGINEGRTRTDILQLCAIANSEDAPAPPYDPNSPPEYEPSMITEMDITEAGDGSSHEGNGNQGRRSRSPSIALPGLQGRDAPE